MAALWMTLLCNSIAACCPAPDISVVFRASNSALSGHEADADTDVRCRLRDVECSSAACCPATQIECLLKPAPTFKAKLVPLMRSVLQNIPPRLWIAALSLWLSATLATHAHAQAAPEDPLLAPPAEAPRKLRSWNEALRLVRQHAPRYQKEFENVMRARAQSQLAIANVLPNLNGESSYTRQFITERVAFSPTSAFDTPVPNVVGAAATLSWQLGNIRNYFGIGSADLNTAATERGFAEQRRQIASSVMEAMLATLVTARVAELNRVGLRAALEREQLARKRLHYGQGTTLDIDRSTQDVMAARSEVVQGDEATRRAREALALALGSSTPTAAAAELDLEGFERSVVDTCRLNNSVEARPDVAAARLRMQLAGRAISDAWLQFAPSIALASHVTYSSQVTYGPKTTWDMQAVLSVPFFDATRYAHVEDARSAERQAQADLTAARLQALIEVAQAGRASDVARQMLAIAEDARALAEHVDRGTRAQFADGLATSLELVNSAQSLRRAQLNAVQARFELSHARAAQVLSLAECQY
jgi:outer membrane protein TolC